MSLVLTGNLFDQDSLGEGDRRTASAYVDGYHTNFQAVASGLVLDHKAARFLHILVDCFPVLSWTNRDREFTELLFGSSISRTLWRL